MQALIIAHAPALRRLATAEVGPDLADDAVSEAFAEAWRTRSSYDPSLGTERAWLAGIVINRCLAMARAQRRWHRRARRSLDGHVDVSDFSDATHDRLDARANGRVAFDALRALPEAQRNVLLLVAIVDMEPVEVASVLGLPPATVRSHLLRARRAIAAALDLEEST